MLIGIDKVKVSNQNTISFFFLFFSWKFLWVVKIVNRFYMKSLKIDLWSRKWKWLVIKKWKWFYWLNSFLPSPKAWARAIITRLIEKVKVISFIHHPSDFSFTSLSNGDTIGQISALHHTRFEQGSLSLDGSKKWKWSSTELG